ncbi:MAG: hypothetical protein K0S47_983 [Herbinix sp.]|jgi:DNA helicase-2/ATP-dependent DNA helicase PcrA|nr:hypothetical protein [Herbinix sp.]
MQMNQSQQQAVQHLDGPMLVLAGPGSGKTFVITERTKYLIEHYHIPADRILVITFTKAAATEMRERFLRKASKSHSGVNFGTFHAVFFTILKAAYGYNSSNILREDVKVQFLKEIIHHHQLEYEDEKEFISDISSEISLVKGDQMDLSNYYSIHCADEVFRKIFQEYEGKLRRANLIDFDDMLLFCYQLLSQRKDILEKWQYKFQYILIDEFQDINKVQYDIVRLLAAPRNNLFIVGDDDQSIYRFRGAKPEIMLQFPQDFPGCKQILLDTNYRCTGKIVTAASKLVSHNENRFSKNIQANKENGQDIVKKVFETLAEENNTIAKEILRLQQIGTPLKEIAILVRTNMGSGALLHKLMEYNIPFRMKDVLPNLFDHWITRDLICYIKVALGATDRNLYLQIINRPKRYVSRECFDNPEVHFEQVKDYYEDKEWMLERLESFEYDLAMIAKMTPYAGVNYIRRGIGYEEYLQEYASLRRIKVEELTDLLDELQESAKPYKTYEDWFCHMEEYKEELKQQLEDKKDKNTDSITIATMHSSKGLEYEAVFIVDANEGITPHKKAVLGPDLEEERRLFYVAMTRAKEHLYIYSSKDRYNKKMQSSRFIEELME